MMMARMMFFFLLNSIYLHGLEGQVDVQFDVTARDLFVDGAPAGSEQFPVRREIRCDVYLGKTDGPDEV